MEGIPAPQGMRGAFHFAIIVCVGTHGAWWWCAEGERARVRLIFSTSLVDEPPAHGQKSSDTEEVFSAGQLHMKG